MLRRHSQTKSLWIEDSETCVWTPVSVGNSFLRLLWLLNEHHLYVCLGVYSAKCCNPQAPFVQCGSGVRERLASVVADGKRRFKTDQLVSWLIIVIFFVLFVCPSTFHPSCLRSLTEDLDEFKAGHNNQWLFGLSCYMDRYIVHFLKSQQ